MLEMKIKYDYLSEHCIEEVLFELNRIYLSKEEKALGRLTHIHELEIAGYRKQLCCSYDELLAKKQIERLKKEVQVAKHLQKSKVAPKLTNLRDRGQLEDQLKLK
jgi:hypothetical protein